MTTSRLVRKSINGFMHLTEYFLSPSISCRSIGYVPSMSTRQDDERSKEVERRKEKKKGNKESEKEKNCASRVKTGQTRKRAGGSKIRVSFRQSRERKGNGTSMKERGRERAANGSERKREREGRSERGASDGKEELYV